jgi:hypothetical protein
MVEGQRFARDTATNALVTIGLNEAHRLRPRCAAGELICPVPACTAPAITTVIGHRRSNTEIHDYFRHINGTAVATDHDGESFAHWFAKMQLADMAVRCGYRAEVELADSISGRKPDVTVTTPTSRIALEVQFSSLTVEDWEARTTALENAGFTVRWIWGLLDAEAEADLTGAQQADRGRTGRTWHVTTALDRPMQLATGIVTSTWRRAKLTGWPHARTNRVGLIWRDPSQLVIDPTTALVDPLTEDVIRTTNQRHHRALLAALANVIAGHNARSEPGRNPATPAPFVQQHMPRTEYRPALPAPAAATSIRGGLHPDVAPPSVWNEVIKHTDRADEAIYVAPGTWKAAIADRLSKQAPGTLFGADEITDQVSCYARTADADAVSKAIRRFLDACTRTRLIEHASLSRYRIPSVELTLPLLGPPPTLSADSQPDTECAPQCCASAPPISHTRRG